MIKTVIKTVAFALAVLAVFVAIQIGCDWWGCSAMGGQYTIGLNHHECN